MTGTKIKTARQTYEKMKQDFIFGGEDKNFPSEAIKIIQKVLDDNAHKYPPANWRSIPLEEHLSHARQHIQQWISYHTNNLIRESMELPTLAEEEPHLAHALTRLAFAAELELLKEEKK